MIDYFDFTYFKVVSVPKPLVKATIACFEAKYGLHSDIGHWSKPERKIKKMY